MKTRLHSSAGENVKAHYKELSARCWSGPAIQAAIFGFAWLGALLMAVAGATADTGEDDFVDSYDLNGDYARYVYRVEGMRVWNQSENGYGCREWGPTETGKWGTLVIRYCFDRPIETASLQALIQLYLPGDETTIAVSDDDHRYTVIATGTMVADGEIHERVRVIDLTPHLIGKRTVYIRLMAKGKRLNTHITTPSVMRTVKAFKSETSPPAYEFRATFRELVPEVPSRQPDNGR